MPDDRPEPLGDRVKLLELAVATIADRTLEIEQLATATDRLSESTGGLESALREVGQIRERQDELESKVDDDVTPALDSLKREAVPRSRLVLTILVVGALVAAVAWGWRDRMHIKSQVRDEQTRTCQLLHDLHPNRSC